MKNMLMVVLLAALIVAGAGVPEHSREGTLVINGNQFCDDNPASDAPQCIYIPWDPFNIDAVMP